MTTSERSILEARRDELAPWVCGFDPQERDRAALALLGMFGGFRSMDGRSDEQLAATVDGLLRILADQPLWAIEHACERVRAHGYTRKDGDRYVTERHWPPSDSEMVEIVRNEAKLLRDQYNSAVALLNARVEA